jgi:hypothetical protein
MKLTYTNGKVGMQVALDKRYPFIIRGIAYDRYILSYPNGTRAGHIPFNIAYLYTIITNKRNKPKENIS